MMEQTIIEATKVKVGNLEKNNWTAWKYKIKAALGGLGLLDIAEGRVSKPELTDSVGKDKFNRELSDYNRANSAALLLITTNLSDENLHRVMRFTNVREVWLELHRLFAGEAKDRAYDLCLQFFGYKKQQNDEIATHLSKMKNIWFELSQELKNSDIRGELPELFLICKILDTLPEEYFSFKASWLLMAQMERTVENLTSSLCVHERALSSKNNVEETGEVLNIIARSAKKIKKKNDKCHYCGNVGHWIRQCDKWLSDGRPPKPSSSKNVSMSLMSINTLMSLDNDGWYVDNGATSHVTHRNDLFETFEPFNDAHTVTTASGEAVQAVGKGTLIVEADVEGVRHMITLNDVWYVPNVKKNLFSVLSAQERLLKSNFMSTATLCKLSVDGTVKLIGERQRQGGLYKLRLTNVKPTKPIEINSLDSKDLLQLYHERFGHQNKRHVKDLVKRELGIDLKSDSDVKCEGCIYGKAHRLKFGKRNSRATVPGQILHGDVCGPFPDSFCKYRYYVLFKDDFTGYRMVYFLKQKSEVKDKLALMLAETKAAAYTIKCLFSDGGGEFDNADVKKILEQNGIMHRITMPHTPQQNGCVERDNRTVVEAARAIMHAKELPQRLWAELVQATVYILNRTGPTQLDKTPYEMWYNQKPRIQHLRIIGSICYAHIPKITRKKLDKKAVKGVFIGYDNDEGYRVWLKETNKMIRSRDVIFEENILKPTNLDQISVEQTDPITFDAPILSQQLSQNESIIDEASSGEFDETLINRDVNGETDVSDYESVQSNEEFLELDPESEEILPNREIEEEGRMTLRDRSTLKPPDRFGEFVMSAVNDFIELKGFNEPQNYNQAIHSKDSYKWKVAMDEEMNSLRENKTWEMVPLPKNKKAIPCKWVYKVKFNPDGTVERYKARLVVKGYSQRKGIDFFETFSPVAKMSTIRVMLSIAARDKMSLTQFDVSTAFLYGNINEEIYMKPPEGYSDGSNKVCKLKRSLYGLKQAPCCWNNCVTEFLEKVGFKKSEADPCLFIRQRGEKKLILALYVDDGLLASTNQEEADDFVQELKSRFKIKSKTASYFLGLEIDRRNDGSLNITQTAYTKKLLERFQMQDCKAVGTPILKDNDMPRLREDAHVQKFPYRQAVGALAYLMVGTRPDIAYAVSVVSRHLDNPTSDDVVKVKRILRYLQGTNDKGLQYGGEQSRHHELKCYSDADHGGDVDTGRSTTGMVCLYAGTAVSWKSHRQPSVAISSTEAEIVAASETAREIIWMNRLIRSIESSHDNIPELFVDNESAIKLAHNPSYEMHQRTKHIRIRHFFVRECVADGILRVKKVSSEFQLADMLTKPLFKPRLVALCKGINLQ